MNDTIKSIGYAAVHTAKTLAATLLKNRVSTMTVPLDAVLGIAGIKSVTTHINIAAAMQLFDRVNKLLCTTTDYTSPTPCKSTYALVTCLDITENCDEAWVHLHSYYAEWVLASGKDPDAYATIQEDAITTSII